MMSRFSPEAKVGIFVLIGLCVLTYFTLKVGDLKINKSEAGSTVTALFDAIAGLETRSNVRYAGVKIGYVDVVELVDGKAKVTMRIQPGIKLRADATAMVASLGMLGEKYIEIRGGTSLAPLVEDGGAIKGSSPTSLDQLVDSINTIGTDVKAITESIRDVVGSEHGKASLQNIVENIEQVTARLRDMVADNQSQVNTIIANVDDLTGELKQIITANQVNINDAIGSFNDVAASLKDTMPAILENLDRLTRDIGILVRDNTGNVDETLDNIKLASRELHSSLETIDSITRKIDAGQGTLGKLVNEEETHDNLNTALEGLNDTLDAAQSFLGGLSKYRTYLGYRAEFLQDPEEWKNIVSIRLQPRKDKFYLIELIDSPYGYRRWEEYDITTESSVTGLETQHIRKEIVEDKLLFSLQIAKRLDHFVLRGGLIESTGGIGADLKLWDDRISLSVEGFDFNRDQQDFHLKLTSELRIMDYLQVFAGLDDALVEENRTTFFGLGLRFEDEDFKFLLGILPLSSFGS
ncbi:MCE family protein [bacterium]|nr:MCE family protein [candidate division CSSED10-310 bacterium]